MFRTALGESTASLDSTVRSGWIQAPSLVPGRGRSSARANADCQASGAALAVCPAVLADVWLPMCSGSLLGQRSFQSPMGPSWHVPKVPSNVGWSCHATP